MKALLNATAALPKVALVDPAGGIRSIAIAPNVATPLLTDGKLSESARSAGWADLLELYAAEGDSEGAAAWASMVAARASGQSVRFPDELLPDEVRRRRDAAKASRVWTPPKRKPKPEPKGKTAG